VSNSMSEKTREEKIAYIHKKIDAFADLMKDRMETNLHKGTEWRSKHFAELFLDAVTELGNLSSALLGNGIGGKMQVPIEAADVANLMMMLVDSVWGLGDEDPPASPSETGDKKSQGFLPAGEDVSDSDQ